MSRGLLATALGFAVLSCPAFAFGWISVRDRAMNHSAETPAMLLLAAPVKPFICKLDFENAWSDHGNGNCLDWPSDDMTTNAVIGFSMHSAGDASSLLPSGRGEIRGGPIQLGSSPPNNAGLLSAQLTGAYTQDLQAIHNDEVSSTQNYGAAASELLQPYSGQSAANGAENNQRPPLGVAPIKRSSAARTTNATNRVVSVILNDPRRLLRDHRNVSAGLLSCSDDGDPLEEGIPAVRKSSQWKSALENDLQAAFLLCQWHQWSGVLYQRVSTAYQHQAVDRERALSDPKVTVAPR